MTRTQLRLLFTLPFILLPFSLMSQELDNYLHLGGVGNDRSQAVEVDASGNIYLAGFFSGTSDFDPSASVFNLTSNGNADIFLAKYDQLGNFAWAVSMGGTEFDEAKAITVDGAGDVYITGRFRQTVDFDPSPGGTFNLTSNGDADGFVVKIDANGAFQWAFQIGSSLADEPFDIKWNSGLILVGGQFQQTADFDPSVANNSLTSNGSYDAFLAAYDDAGTYQWAVNIGGTSGDACYGIDTDASGNTYMTGYFSGTVDFDPGLGTTSFTSTGNADAYLCKLDDAGAYLWAFPIGGTGFFSDDGRDVAVDGSGNVYITGRFVGTADFDPAPGSATLTAFGVISGFVAKYFEDGTYQWAFPLRNVSFVSSTTPQAIEMGGLGEFYLTGSLSSEVDFDPSANDQNRTSSGSTDLFLAKYSAAGSFEWVTHAGGSFGDEGLGLALGGIQIHMAGYFTGSMDVDPSPNTINLSSLGGTDLLMTQMNGITLPVEWTGFEAIQEFAGVRLDWTTSYEFHNHHFTVQRSIDGALFTEIGLVLSLGNSTQGHFYSFFDPEPFLGVNYYRIKQVDFDGQSSHSPIINITVGNNDWHWSVFPNPATEFLSWQFSGSKGEVADLEVVNRGGSLMWRLGGISPGSGVVPVADWPSGTYYVHIRSRNGKEEAFEILVY